MTHPEEEKKGLEAVALKIAPPQGPPRERLIELDALRGVAASTVVMSHFTCLWDQAQWPRWMQILILDTPFFIFTAAHEAVILFFLLSGFVLALPYIRQNAPSYGAFVIKRIFRIYVPYLVAISLAILCASHYHGLKEFSSWFRNGWSGPVDLHVVLQHVLFLGMFDTAQYDSPIWSLVYEMRISLFFPLLCLLVLRLPPLAALVLVPILSLVDHELRMWHLVPISLFMLHFTGMFMVGIVIANHRKVLRSWVNSLTRFSSTLLLLLLLACLILPHFLPHYGGPIGDWITEVGAGGLIILSLGENGLSYFLRLPIPQFLGDISYSLYLVHVPILFLLIYTLHQIIPPPWIFIPYLVLTIAFSSVFYRFVELPAIEMGRRVSGRLG